MSQDIPIMKNIGINIQPGNYNHFLNVKDVINDQYIGGFLILLLLLEVKMSSLTA